MATRRLYDLLEKLHLRKKLEGSLYENRSIAYLSPIKGDHSFGDVFSFDLSRKLEVIGPDAVYYFNKHPMILFFDLSEQTDEEKKRRISKQVWCLDKSPVIILINSTDYHIYNAFRYEKSLDTETNLERVEMKDDVFEELFSFWSLESGNTWSWFEQNIYKTNFNQTRVNQVLFKNIQYASNELVNLHLTPEAANLLILQIIFCRYLIDRDVEFNPRYLRGKDINERRLAFNEILADEEKLSNLFNYLKARFNGNLFETTLQGVKPKAFNLISKIFSGNISNQQGFLFDVFDFSIIPVEVISGIYESIINPIDRQMFSAVYTPTFLVEYVLEKTVNKYLYKGNKECKVLDSACGSGIFLVLAYRNMIEKQNVITDEVLIRTLQENIFGVDKDAKAINVAIFSIYVALLDYKSPKSLIDFKLPKLKDKNLFLADFFDNHASFNKNENFAERKFQFIIGNPPWGKKK